MTKIRRIAILTRTYPPKGGGIAAAHFALAQCLKERHEIAVFAFDDDEEDREANVYRAKTPQWLAKIMKWLALMWVRHYAKKESATNCQWIFSVAPAVWKLNKSIRAFNPVFILCPDNFVPALALGKPRGAKLIWIAHHNFRRFEGNPIACDYSWIDLQLAHRLERRALKKADAIVAVSDYMADVTQKVFEPEQLITVIRNYVDVGRLEQIQTSDLRNQLVIPDSIPLVYIPSAGSAVKGERYTFELIRRLGSGGKVAFFLSGAISSSLRFELKHLGSKIKIHAPGAQAYEQNLSDVAACDLTVSPTLIENLSSALIESLALGVPVVSFDVGGNSELVQSGINGCLSPYLDIEDLISSAAELLKDNARLKEMKSQARFSITEIVNPERVLKEYDQLFEKLAVNDK